MKRCLAPSRLLSVAILAGLAAAPVMAKDQDPVIHRPADVLQRSAGDSETGTEIKGHLALVETGRAMSDTAVFLARCKGLEKQGRQQLLVFTVTGHWGTTDADGRFGLPNVPAGTYALETEISGPMKDNTGRVLLLKVLPEDKTIDLGTVAVEGGSGSRGVVSVKPSEGTEILLVVSKKMVDPNS